MTSHVYNCTYSTAKITAAEFINPHDISFLLVGSGEWWSSLVGADSLHLHVLMCSGTIGVELVRCPDFCKEYRI